MTSSPQPMRGHDLKQLINWGTEHPFTALSRYLTRDWAAEPKLDGCRAQLAIGAGSSRFGGNRSASFPALASIAIPALDGTVIDGEFLAPPIRGRSLLGRSAGLFNSGPAHAARIQAAYGPARFCVFDVLTVAGEDTTRQPYTKRRELLSLVAQWLITEYPACGIELVPELPATEDTLRRVLEDGGEGVMLKRRAGRYHPGQRSWDWVKIKRFATVDAWLTGGYKPGKNSRAGTVGAVEIAVTAPGGPQVIGHCAVPPAWVPQVTASDGSLRADAAGTVIEVMAQGIGVGGLLRHPHLVRLRPDKTPADCDATQLGALARV